MTHDRGLMLKVSFPFNITDLNDSVLLPANVSFDESMAGSIAELGRRKNHPTSCLLKHGSVRTDLEDFMQKAPYDVIFDGPEGVSTHLERIGEVPVSAPLLDILDNFRAHDFYTYRHSLTVFALTSFLLNSDAHGEHVENNLLMVGPTHDLGKLLIPDQILNKRTPLTHEERCLLEQHTVAGYILLCYYLGDHTHPAALAALNHHERRDGSGYLRGLNELDPVVEMLAACDVYDALISSRPYRPVNYDNRSALEELTDIAAAGALDWRCVQALIGRNRAGHPTPDQVDVSLEKRGYQPPENCYARFADDEATSPQHLIPEAPSKPLST